MLRKRSPGEHCAQYGHWSRRKRLNHAFWALPRRHNPGSGSPSEPHVGSNRLREGEAEQWSSHAPMTAFPVSEQGQQKTILGASRSYVCQSLSSEGDLAVYPQHSQSRVPQSRFHASIGRLFSHD